MIRVAQKLLTQKLMRRPLIFLFPFLKFVTIVEVVAAVAAMEKLASAATLGTKGSTARAIYDT
ncbi:MAG: hypothetical protein AAGA67_11875 [Cyanobacteria bacterium P01_F01_bin.153]